MSIFGDESERLLRESWSGPDELAEELYAIFTSTQPLQTGPIQITNPPGSTVPPIAIDNLGNTTTSVSITTNPSPTPNFPELPPIPPLPGIGSPVVNLLGPDGLPTETGPPGGPFTPSPPIAGGGGGGVPAQVVSGGPGKGPYTMTAYPNGLGGGGLTPTTLTVKATQLQIADDETIPAGTWAILNKVGTTYYMQVPVWAGGTP